MDQIKTSIKASAKLAKKRLITGYWTEIRRIRDADILQSSSKDIHKLQEAYARKIERKLDEENAGDSDSVLYKKVCKLLSQDNFVLNPISRLIDHNIYDKLSDMSKQNYLLKLSRKYNELQERYYNETKQNNSKINYC